MNVQATGEEKGKGFSLVRWDGEVVCRSGREGWMEEDEGFRGKSQVNAARHQRSEPQSRNDKEAILAHPLK